MTGLMYYRPEDHIGYLQDCLSKLQDEGSDSVTWKRFIDQRRTPLPPIAKQTNGLKRENSSDSSMCLVLSCPVLSSCVLPCPVLGCLVLFCPVVSCPVLSCPCLALFSCVLSCPALLCPVLSCPVLSLFSMLYLNTRSLLFSNKSGDRLTYMIVRRSFDLWSSSLMHHQWSSKHHHQFIVISHHCCHYKSYYYRKRQDVKLFSSNGLWHINCIFTCTDDILYITIMALWQW